MKDRGPQTLIHVALQDFPWRPKHILSRIATLPWAPGYLEVRDKDGLTVLAKAVQRRSASRDVQDLLEAKADIQVMVPGSGSKDPERDLLQLCCDDQPADDRFAREVTEILVRNGFPLKEKIEANPDLYGSVSPCILSILSSEAPVLLVVLDSLEIFALSICYLHLSLFRDLQKASDCDEGVGGYGEKS